MELVGLTEEKAVMEAAMARSSHGGYSGGDHGRATQRRRHGCQQERRTARGGGRSGGHAERRGLTAAKGYNNDSWFVGLN
ncbi:hypothetical protein SESBI_23290 [Sesbania bispinosa]|nr:hypothetical protein SESBI_23290 [Sesbania bispinosa]